MTDKFENIYSSESEKESNTSHTSESQNAYYSENISDNPNKNFEDVQSNSQKFENTDSTADNAKAESSYEWNADSNSTSNGEYHYSYINGNNENAPHNPNNYNNRYANSSADSYQTDSQNPYTNGYSSSAGYSGSDYSSTNYQQNNDYSSQNQTYSNTTNSYYGYSQNSPYQAQNYSANSTYTANQSKSKPKKEKKPSKPASKKFVAAMLVVSILTSSLLGFGGGYLFSRMNTTTKGSLNITQVEPSNKTDATNTVAGVTSQIVKKTADSVVEIVTEKVVTGSFASQYVQQGAGSGVIISEDGYIITNYHVIEGANSVTVTLRDGKTGYTAAIIGSDEDNDIALLKIDAKDLSPAVFGNSSDLAVGDYVVAIGNPLGELGGTVTDGIISALAREVEIEDKNMTLLQTNAQISPGNSGGGLFNSAGELIGIVNAKDSATEVEGIAFAIPINTVLDIINDLREYGYVTGKIDLGMELMDINSKETAFYYGVNQTGCYVLSVTKGSNADEAGFNTGDLITKVDGKDIEKSDDVDKAIEDKKVGDKVTFTVYRSGKNVNIELVLAEYTPSGKTYNNEESRQFYQGSDDFWSQIFGW